VTVLPGQSGLTNDAEGTAMLEIINDLAPGAELYFAWNGARSSAEFADNVRLLEGAGCQIIVDDVTLLDESPFQDGIAARAVNDVTEVGVLFFRLQGTMGTSTSESTVRGRGIFLTPETGCVR